MTKLLSLIFVLLFLFTTSLHAADRRQFEDTIQLEDQVPVSIVVVDDADREVRAHAVMERAFAEMRQLELQVRDAITRIEAATANETIPLSPAALTFLRKALDLSALSEGWFDIAAPSPRSLFTKRDWRRIVLDDANHTVTLLSRWMKFDIRWLLHGMVVDAALATLVQDGVTNARVTVGEVSRFIGRDIFTPWGLSLNLAPTGEARTASRAYTYDLSSAAVATMTAQQAEHLVDAKSKRPVVPTFKSITVVATEAATAAAFAQALISFAPPVGFVFLQSHSSIKGMIVDRGGKIFASPEFAHVTRSPADIPEIRTAPDTDQGPSDLRQKWKEEGKEL
ncbi:MAG: FAD:protein FMN transferase [Deltaproteobacteria bacterium]|nr:FAD:protein FMN transferase [Deltaproteobacteria bacterium]